MTRKLVAAALQPVMLSLLSGRDMYGYEIIEMTHSVSGGALEWSSNKLYPLLHGLEQDGLLESYWRPSDDGPDRKYYHLTDHGRTVLETSQADWRRVVAILSRLWGPSFDRLQPAH